MNKSLLKKMKTENSVYFAEITPAAAAKLLLNNAVPRQLNRGYATKLAKAMKNGEFELTTDCIGINKEGQLTNGQHRLQAAVIANMTVPMPVMEGVEASMFQDRGRKRSIVCNAMALEPGNELVNSSNVAAVTLLAKVAGKDILETECVRAINDHADLFHKLQECYHINNVNRRSVFLAAALLALMNGVTPQRMSDYSELLTTGMLKGKVLNKSDEAVVAARDNILGRRRGFQMLESRNPKRRIEVLCNAYASVMAYNGKNIRKEKLHDIVCDTASQFITEDDAAEASAA